MGEHEIVIKKIRELVKQKGYIYALCMIIFEDFHINPEKLHEINTRGRLSVKETSLLLGFLIQDEIDYTLPETPHELIRLKQSTYELVEKLHESIMSPFKEKLVSRIKKEHKTDDFRTEYKNFFGTGDMLIEPIFYSSTGTYDFQYMNLLERKYRYDKEWLTSKKAFELDQVKYIVFKIKGLLQEKSQKVHLYDLKERIPKMLSKKKKYNKRFKKYIRDILPMMEFHQYVELFFEYIENQEDFSIDKIREDAWKSFYKGLLDLFIIKKSDFDNNTYVESFLNNFSIYPCRSSNTQFKTIGNYNLINSHPIIKLTNEKFFIPITFLLFEAVYESPFYWMTSDKEYRDKAGENRGIVGEEITYDLISKVFGINRIFKSVKVSTKKRQTFTDIDVLCILGSKALCIQVKSKKLTELSKTGDDNAIYNDFRGAVQDAYEQGLISREKIIEKSAIFIDVAGKEIKLSEEIDDAYIMVITTENYSALTLQTQVLLEKNPENPFPIVLTIFDLELVTHYLNDPYDFLYYIRQRTSLFEYFRAEEESVFLGYHLDKKLWKIPKVDMLIINNDFAQLIDRNYYPLKAGLEVTDEGDVIKNRWKNDMFDCFCKELKNVNQAKITDILFYLFDMSGDSRTNIIDLISSTKKKTLLDEKSHNFSMPPDYDYYPRVGITYVSLDNDDISELRIRLSTLCQIRKYKSRGDIWIGFGSLRNKSNMIDAIVFMNQFWEYDAELEKMTECFFQGIGEGNIMRISKKVGRNERCPCGSMLKYKNCCGKK